MTVSFHKYGDNFFPGTGSVWDKGFGNGEYYAVNFPLKDGMNDESYENAFRPVIRKVIEMFRPSAIVMQCGVDGLANDSLGSFNMTIKGHANCVQFVKGFNIPTLVLGGGGYNMCNVARCWVYETGVILNMVPDDRIPYNDYWEYFAPDHKLHFSADKSVKNLNTPSYIGKVTEKIMENLRCLSAAPSVQMQEIPSVLYCSDDEDGLDPDRRNSSDKRQMDGEFYDDEEDFGMDCS
ncbi:histone deacetylase [Gracilaria domingensis]|nr:histone deacetylase [Gracilaria domingensis]